ncbi:hypothetical protein ES703_50215 [subsurface metagenome]
MRGTILGIVVVVGVVIFVGDVFGNISDYRNV